MTVKRSGFEAVVQEYQRRVHTFAHYLLADPEDARDAAQEAFLRLWRHWPRVDESRREAWLFRVTRNLCYDRLRKVKAGAERTTASLDDPQALHLADGNPDPEHRAQGADTRRRLTQALNALQEPYRSTVLLREVQGLSYQEISDILETPVNTVKVHLHRGRKRLRDALREAHVYENAG